MLNLDSEAPSASMQHLLWFLGHPELYVSAILYASAIAIWVWALRKVVFEKAKGMKYRLVLAFYSVFLVVLVITLYARYQYYSGLL